MRKRKKVLCFDSDWFLPWSLRLSMEPLKATKVYDEKIYLVLCFDRKCLSLAWGLRPSMEPLRHIVLDEYPVLCFTFWQEVSGFGMEPHQHSRLSIEPLKAGYTRSDCQRTVSAHGVSMVYPNIQCTHKITNLWKFRLNWLSTWQENIEREKRKKTPVA